MKPFFIIVIAVFLLPKTVIADDLKGTAVINDMKKQGASFSETFKVGEKLTGIISEYQGRTYPIYRVNETKYLIYGDLHNVSGVNLTEEHIKLYPVSIGGQDIWQRLQQAKIIENSAKPNSKDRVFYSFIDTNCPYCKIQWREMQPYLKKGLKLKYIPVGFISDKSEPQAAFILDSDNPYQTLKSSEEGASLPRDLDSESISKDAIREVRKNTYLMEELGIRATPALLYQDKDGEVYLVEGKISSDHIERLIKE